MIRHKRQNQNQQMRQTQEAEESTHWKDPSLNSVEQGSTSSTTTTTSSSSSSSSSTTTTQVAPTTPTLVSKEEATQRPYPANPSTVKAATAYSLFSDPNAFDLESIYAKKHYITSSLGGKIWWDVNGDAKQGDYGNSTLNDMEYDHGIPNVGNIILVSCDDSEEKRGSTSSKPYNGRDAIPLRQSLISESGKYDFQELNNIPLGRYYVMYEAPKGWRVSENILPLGRREGLKDGEVYYECVTEGENGKSFVNRAQDSGDFDYGGYCGRSIGCLEIGSQTELH
jgi:hypothetical protein